MSHPEPDKPNRSETRSGGMWAGWLIALVLLLYVLSVPPVIKLFGRKPPVAVQYFYAPLEYTYDHSAAVKTFYDWYFQLWRVKP